jgi:hypothetical protein
VVSQAGVMGVGMGKADGINALSDLAFLDLRDKVPKITGCNFVLITV